MARYAIGDVHGCFLTVREMCETSLGITPTDTVIFLGDYVDRGPNSREVLDYIRTLKANGYNVVSLRGNHDDLVVQGRLSPERARFHLSAGGIPTLQSFNVTDHVDIPLLYCDQIDEMPFVHEEPDFLCVHASVNTRSHAPYEEFQTLMWERLADDDTDSAGRRVIAGHTPQTLDMIRDRIDTGRKIILDGGCCYPHRVGLGYLCSMDLDTLQVIAVKNIDRM